jgi:uncharacterized protein YlxW (UPF0749 family)
MEQVIKLRPKQKEILERIQAKKQEFNKLFQDLNDKESAIIELMLEEAEIVPPVGAVELKGDTLVVTLADPQIKKSKQKKQAEIA